MNRDDLAQVIKNWDDISGGKPYPYKKWFESVCDVSYSSLSKVEQSTWRENVKNCAEHQYFNLNILEQ